MQYEESRTFEIRIEASAKQADELLDRLAGDQEFRERYEAEPQEVLAEYGIFVSGESLEHFRQLPSPMEIQRLRDLLVVEHREADVGSRQLGWVCFVEPHAMPLMVTAEEGDEPG